MKEPQTHEEFIWLLRFIPTNADVNIIDIGGNSGYWAEEIMSYYVSSKVYGFEPVQEMYDQYKARFQFRNNVNIYNSALGDTVEEKFNDNLIYLILKKASIIDKIEQDESNRNI